MNAIRLRMKLKRMETVECKLLTAIYVMGKKLLNYEIKLKLKVSLAAIIPI